MILPLMQYRDLRRCSYLDVLICIFEERALPGKSTLELALKIYEIRRLELPESSEFSRSSVARMRFGIVLVLHRKTFD